MMSVVGTTHHHRMVSSLALTATARACYDVDLTSVQEKVGHLEQLNVLSFSRPFFSRRKSEKGLARETRKIQCLQIK